MKAIVESKEFKRVIKALKPFTRLDVEKMQYIVIDVNSDTQEVRFEALDGSRIAVEYLKCDTDVSFKAYIKPFAFMAVKEEFTEIEMINEKAYVSMGDYRIGFKQPVGEWYKTKELIKEMETEEPILKIGIDAKLLIDALKNVKGKYGKDMVVIECRDKKSPVIIKDLNDKRNTRVVLPLKFNE